MKYKKDEIISFANKLFKITNCNRCGFTGKEYDIEAVMPNKNGQFDKHIKIPEGFIEKNNK